jgi:hypothetical protein
MLKGIFRFQIPLRRIQLQVRLFGRGPQTTQAGIGDVHTSDLKAPGGQGQSAATIAAGQIQEGAPGQVFSVGQDKRRRLANTLFAGIEFGIPTQALWMFFQVGGNGFGHISKSSSL